MFHDPGCAEAELISIDKYYPNKQVAAKGNLFLGSGCVSIAKKASLLASKEPTDRGVD